MTKLGRQGRRQLLAQTTSTAARTTTHWGPWTPLTSHRSQTLVLICKIFEGTGPGSSCSSGLTDMAQLEGPGLAGALPSYSLGESWTKAHRVESEPDFGGADKRLEKDSVIKLSYKSYQAMSRNHCYVWHLGSHKIIYIDGLREGSSA